MPLGTLVPEHVVFQIAIPEAHMGVPTAPIFLVIPLSHKAGSEPHLVTNFLDARFEKHGSITSSDGIGITYVHFIHAWPVLAIVPFNLHTMVAHHTGNAAQQVIISACLANGIAVKAR